MSQPAKVHVCSMNASFTPCLVLNPSGFIGSLYSSLFKLLFSSFILQQVDGKWQKYIFVQFLLWQSAV